jgi:hypothetical protein
MVTVFYLLAGSTPENHEVILAPWERAVGLLPLFTGAINPVRQNTRAFKTLGPLPNRLRIMQAQPAMNYH